MNCEEFYAAESLKHIFIDLKQMQEFVKNPLIIIKADGVWYEDGRGKKYLDGISGIFVVGVGHNNRRVIEAIKQQLDELAFAPPLHATTIPALRLAKMVSEITPEDLNTVKLVSGGSEATESAMKLARQYHRQTGNPGKYKVIARYQGFHGATMGALSATGVKRRKTMFEPLLEGFIHVFPPTCYRCPYGLEYPSCKVLCASIINDVIDHEGAATVSAVILEPIGNTGGIVIPPAEYLPMIRDICNRHRVLLIFDEIITGFGRTGKMFAAQTFNTTPDIICMGKGMSSGYSPLGAIAFRDSIAQAFFGKEEDEVEFSHGHTFGGNPVSSMAGIACINEIRARDLCGQSLKMGRYLRQELERVENLGVVGEIRGRGLLLGIEFVKNRKNKEPFGNKFGVRVGKAALQKGLLVRFDPNWIAFAPPLIVNEKELKMMVDILVESIKETLSAG